MRQTCNASEILCRQDLHTALDKRSKAGFLYATAGRHQSESRGEILRNKWSTQTQIGAYWAARKSNSGHCCCRSDLSAKDTAGYDDRYCSKGARLRPLCAITNTSSYFFFCTCTYKIILFLFEYLHLKYLSRNLKRKGAALTRFYTVFPETTTRLKHFVGSANILDFEFELNRHLIAFHFKTIHLYSNLATSSVCNLFLCIYV